MRADLAQVTGAAPLEQTPIDADSISETIRQALHFGSVRPSRDERAAVDEILRGHVRLLLGDVRAATERQRHSFEAEQLLKRMERIEQHMVHPFGQGLLTADAEAHQRARDCQWLLAHHTARVGW
ncbi:DUF6415 family natural product biosynthesis protein [Streptomyces noursei]|uniref:DUF6415 family natural product biosynthesis protein n=1 Tax=Streptomyces noursei TaxID=1971 RepID=UPI001964A7CD|nr:DUF6415 family natural product biosynthesis protein [Streptomyces noursei]QRX90669.1 hypothetical protein JNO44_07355 [Streptomyces noursei]